MVTVDNPELPTGCFASNQEMTHFPGYTTGLENFNDKELRKALDYARAECSRGCADMEGMTARVFGSKRNSSTAARKPALSLRTVRQGNLSAAPHDAAAWGGEVAGVAAPQARSHDRRAARRRALPAVCEVYTFDDATQAKPSVRMVRGQPPVS